MAAKSSGAMRLGCKLLARAVPRLIFLKQVPTDRVEPCEASDTLRARHRGRQRRAKRDEQNPELGKSDGEDGGMAEACQREKSLSRAESALFFGDNWE